MGGGKRHLKKHIEKNVRHTAVAATASLVVQGPAERAWVSRGAHKLIGALDRFGIEPAGRRCLDAGA